MTPSTLYYKNQVRPKIGYCRNMWTEAAQYSFYRYDRVQHRLCGLVGVDVFSTLQPVSPKSHCCNPITILLLFSWQLPRRIPFYQCKPLQLGYAITSPHMWIFIISFVLHSVFFFLTNTATLCDIFSLWLLSRSLQFCSFQLRAQL